MLRFTREGDRIRADFSSGEGRFLGDVVRQVAELVEATCADSAVTVCPADVGPFAQLSLTGTAQVPPERWDLRQRLFPAASRDDEAISASFAELTFDDLYRTKLERLRALAPRFGFGVRRIDIPMVEAPGLAATLDDVRMVLAALAGVDSDDAADAVFAASRNPSCGWVFLASAYVGFTVLQDQLLTVLLEDLNGPGYRDTLADRTADWPLAD